MCKGAVKRRTLYRSGPRSWGLSRSCRASWSAALRSRSTAFSSSRMAFMPMLILAIELVQPVVGRSFDANDVILNFTGVLLSTGLFQLIRHFISTNHI